MKGYVSKKKNLLSNLTRWNCEASHEFIYTFKANFGLQYRLNDVGALNRVQTLQDAQRLAL